MGRTRISINLKRLQSRWVSHHCNKQAFRSGQKSFYFTGSYRQVRLEHLVVPVLVFAVLLTRGLLGTVFEIWRKHLGNLRINITFRMITIGGKKESTTCTVERTILRKEEMVFAPTCDKHRRTDNTGHRVESPVSISLYSPYSLFSPGQDKISWTYLLLPFPKRTTLNRRKTIDNLPPSGCRVMFCSVWMMLVTLVNPLRISEGLRGCRDCLASCK